MKRKFWNFEYTLRLMFGDSKNPFGAQITRQQLDVVQNIVSSIQCCGAGQFFRWFWFCLGVVFDSYSTKVKSLISNIILNCRPVKMLLFSRNTHIYFVKISTFRRLGVDGAGDTPQWRLRLRQNTRLYGSATLLYTKRRYIQINCAKYRLDLLPNDFAYIKSLTWPPPPKKQKNLLWITFGNTSLLFVEYRDLSVQCAWTVKSVHYGSSTYFCRFNVVQNGVS